MIRFITTITGFTVIEIQEGRLSPERFKCYNPFLLENLHYIYNVNISVA